MLATEMQAVTVEIGLNAAIVAVVNRSPRILAINEADGDTHDSLPFGPFDPARHRTFETSLRDRVEKRTALKLGYIEQLYTFGDRGRQRLPGEEGKHMVSVGYLALTRTDTENTERLAEAGAHWRDWYGYLPWEDWRQGRPPILDQMILPALSRWSLAHPTTSAWRQARSDARASGLPSASAISLGTRSACSSATNCSTRRVSCAKQRSTAGAGSRTALLPGRPCATTTAVSSQPRLPACAARSNTGLLSSN